MTTYIVVLLVEIILVLAKMNRQDVINLIKSGITEFTIVTVKQEGYVESKYTLSLVGYIKEFTGIIAQTDILDEKEIIKEIDISYQAMRKFWMLTEKIEIPKQVSYKIEYVSLEEFITNGKQIN